MWRCEEGGAQGGVEGGEKGREVCEERWVPNIPGSSMVRIF